MMDVRGKFGEAKIFTDVVDEASIAQVIEMLNQPFAEGQRVRMMPDIHAGAGCTVGTTMTIGDKICPNLIGVDIGCGMQAVRVDADHIDFAVLDKTIRNLVPSGMNVHTRSGRRPVSIDLESLRCAHACDLERARNSVGTLGGGNHFIEVDRDSAGNLWLVVHSGSRHLGVEIATFYQKAAIENLHQVSADKRTALINSLKAAGRQSEIQNALANLQPAYPHIPDALCWCEGDLMQDYLHDMKIAQQFAVANRQAIVDIILNRMGLHAVDGFSTIHNYIDLDNMILRKGSVSAQKGERLIIPMNMRDGSLICVGKGNPDWNYSAPHGAGRIMSRGQAKKEISLTDFEDSMKNVWTTSVQISTIDESPMAYKPMESILENIVDTVRVVDIIKPVYNFKASE